MKDLESLMIYKQYMELIYYTENIVRKYPKSEKNGLVSSIKKKNLVILNNLLDKYHKLLFVGVTNTGKREKDKSRRLFYLNELDCNLKMIKIFIRVSYKNKYINIRNNGAWSRKLLNIGNLLGSWINRCVRV